MKNKISCTYRGLYFQENKRVQRETLVRSSYFKVDKGKGNNILLKNQDLCGVISLDQQGNYLPFVDHKVEHKFYDRGIVSPCCWVLSGGESVEVLKKSSTSTCESETAKKRLLASERVHTVPFTFKLFSAHF
jgi:hypothetical protein